MRTAYSDRSDVLLFAYALKLKRRFVTERGEK